MTTPSTAKSNAGIFAEIYANNLWGNPATDDEKFYSGDGSHDEKVIIPYIETLIPLLTNNNIRNIVDLGCGDFWIMRHVLAALAEAEYNFFYTGIDVVEELISYNTATFNHPHIRFLCVDVTDDEPLPDGDILIVRQVLQHMNNADIKKVLAKTTKFKFVFVTEHIYDAPDAIHNIDKQTGNIIRWKHSSGVYLEHPPFSFKNLVHLLKIPEQGGIIRSSLIIN